MKIHANEWVTFHPKLDPNGETLQLVQRAVRSLSEVDWMADDAAHVLQQIRAESLRTIEQACPEDRAIARVCVAVFCDLRAQGWGFQISNEQIEAHKPVSNGATPDEEKARIRAGLLLERNQQLRMPTIRTFIEKMERCRMGPNGWVSIYSLMRDGRELADGLTRAAAQPAGPERDAVLRQVTDPYIQPVDDSYCEHTGLALKDVWRYFRYTCPTHRRQYQVATFGFLSAIELLKIIP